MVPFVMYFTSWYTAVFHSTTVRELTYLVLMARVRVLLDAAAG